MGAHHYQLALLPSAFADDASDDLWERDDLWSKQPPSTLLWELRRLLPKETSWGEVEEFQSEDDWGSDLRIVHDGQRDGPVDSIVFRFSPVADSREVLERFLTTARRHGLLVYTRASRCILQPRIEIVERDLKQSTAYRFISDPGAALVEAAANVKGMPKMKKSKLN
jgi:hypothetical protein